jgi:hypothetical protein
VPVRARTRPRYTRRSPRHGGDGGVVGQIDVARLLLGHPAIADLIRRVAGVEGGVGADPAGLVDPLRAEEEELATS